jgi:hypothetical protein
VILGIASLGEALGKALHIAAAAQQLARDVERGFRFVEPAGVERGIGLRDLGQADAPQAVAGLVAVRLLVACFLEEFARAVAVGAVQVACRQRLVRLGERVVQLGRRQHVAQTILLQP